MIRAFAAIALPDQVTEQLEAVQQDMPVPRVIEPEMLHLTLVFLGALSEPDLEEVHLAFEGLSAPGFFLSLSGLGIFGGRRPRVIFAGVADCAPLRQLQGKVERAARNSGVDLPHRRFVPHVTLARINTGRFDHARLERFVAGHADFASPTFEVTDFGLYASHRRAWGAEYEELARYPLAAPQG